MYFNDLFTEIKTTKAYWNLVRKATAPRQQTVVGPLKTESGHLVVKDEEKACLMNTYFASVGEKLALDLPPSTTRLLSSNSVTQTTIVPSLSEVNVSEAGVLRQIKHLKSNKATGPDGISPKLLKLASHAVSPHLTSLFRWSIHHETVYEGWKLARVSPIFKKDDSTDPGNYRPVSILSVPSKLLESEINTAIVNHVTNNNLITPINGPIERLTPLSYFSFISQRNGGGLLMTASQSLSLLWTSEKLLIAYYTRAFWTNYMDSSAFMVNSMHGWIATFRIESSSRR